MPTNTQRVPRPPAPCRFAAVALIAALPITACDDASAPPAAEAAETQAPAPATYTTTGTIRSLPNPGSPGEELRIAHEEIPDFVGPDGQVVGMRAMTMPFPALAEDVSLDDLSVDDEIRFTFVVDYAADPKYVVTEIVPITDDQAAPDQANGDQPSTDSGTAEHTDESSGAH